MLPRPDVLIVGAGVIGLSLALELRSRGLTVVVHERGTPLSQASTAAAGMLAVDDPGNPPALLPLAQRSRSLYPEFLARIEDLSGLQVPLQTQTTWQTMPTGERRRFREHSIDPRQLAPALLRAARNAGIHVESSSEVPLAHRDSPSSAVVHTTGAWASTPLPIFPRKGQMLRVCVPPDSHLDEVHRSEHIYVVPRTQGPQAGTALIGATVEDAGFDTSIQPEALAELRRLGAELVPALGDEGRAPSIEAWAGLRPATPDGLPILGELIDPTPRTGAPRRFVAAGHFRNGILLAPATASALADLIEGRSPELPLEAFSPARFELAGASIPARTGGADDIRSAGRDKPFAHLR